MRRLIACALLALAMSFCVAVPASGETRIALVIGNSAYRSVPRLNNPANDATAVAEALKGAGFTSVKLRLDLDQAGMRSALQTFSKDARSADVALVYFAGHGLESDGKNFLAPVDARLIDQSDLPYEAVPLELVTDAVADARQIGIVLLDACRENPFLSRMRATGRGRSLGRGLAKVEAADNSFIAYAAQAGTIAADGNGRHSPFTEALLQRLPSPGVEIVMLFREIRDDVMSVTEGRQRPFVYQSLGKNPFYFVAGPTTSPTRTTAPLVRFSSLPPVLEGVAAQTLRGGFPTCSGEVRQFIVYFPYDSADLIPEAEAVLDDATRVFALDQGVVIDAHDDTYKPAQQSMALSVRRALGVERRILVAGANAAAMRTRALGELRPAVATGNGVREPLNRRVTIDGCVVK